MDLDRAKIGLIVLSIVQLTVGTNILDSLQKSKIEFLTDKADYFRDKHEIYVEIKQAIFEKLAIPYSLVKVCGSAYWGHSFTTGILFTPGKSDLDIALISDSLFVKCLSEVRSQTRNFSNLVSFPQVENGPPNNVIFQDYAYKKGIIRVDKMPFTKTKLNLLEVAKNLTTAHISHFSNINFFIYDSEASFVVKQIGAVEKFR